MKRLADRSPEEQDLSERLSETLRACRRQWDHFIDLANSRDRLSTMRHLPPAEIAEQTRAIAHVMSETSIEIRRLEFAANRLLLRLGERPIRGLS